MADRAFATRSSQPGKVVLVGAGPGDPELLTFKAARAIGAADWLLVDDLVADGVLAHAQPGARTVRVGKRGGCRSTPQAFIERLMIRLARRGLIVARVKGGDPFVFGRGGEELAALGAAGIAVEVVPGVTAGIAAPAALGIPITHRGLARGAIFVTGHAAGADEPRTEEPRPEEPRVAEPDWERLAGCGLTLVIYMGLTRMAAIASRLRAGGLSAGTPAALIRIGTGGQGLVTTLDALPAAAATFAGPATVVIGEVVGLASLAAERLADAA
jgi:uroporphyrin-III C-methyltransferase